MRSAKRKGCSS